jgi:hypothetical protein
MKRFVLALAILLAAAMPLPASRAAPPDGAERVERNAQSARRARAARARRARMARYRRMVRNWHRRAPRDAVRDWRAIDPPPLVLRPAGRSERYELTPESEEGGFGAEDLAKMKQACRHRDGGSEEIHPRIVDLVYRAAREFDSPWVTVVSGYRPDRATSRHTQGRAIDIALPGISDRRLARFLMKQGFVGVGLYTGSGFVHVDVRARSYFWIDRSPPGSPQRVRRILPRLSERYDREARGRGEEAVPDLADTTDAAEEAPAPADVAGAGG